jgi:hypothetical protein
MMRTSWVTVGMFLVAGCGATRASGPVIAAPAPSAPVVAAAAPAIAVQDTSTTAASAEVALPETVESTIVAPWGAEHLASQAAPRPLLQAWTRADNQGWCAPLAPATLGAGEGARPRVGSAPGGWSLEFDRRGAAGIGANGEVCTTCGRGAFGITGTAMSAEDAEDLLGPGATVFADGGRIDVQANADEPAAVATVVVPGQDCVYQVWSFLGREHLDELVAGLRLVDAN